MIKTNHTAPVTRYIFRFLCLCCIVLSFALVTVKPGYTQSTLVIEVGEGILLPSANDIGTVFVADPAIADATISPGNEVFLFGKTPGRTTLIATGLGGGERTTYVIRIIHSLSEMRRTLGQRFPGEDISISSSTGSLYVSGAVSSDQVRQRAIETIQAAQPDTLVIDELSVTGSNKVRIGVRVLEVSRSKIEDFGVDWDATFATNGLFLETSNRGQLNLTDQGSGSSQINATVDLLVDENIATLVQETVLTTVTREPARFAVGSQIPIPQFINEVQNDDTPTFGVDFRFIGTELTFTPDFVAGNKLRLSIDSTLSTIQENTSEISGDSFPNLNTREFSTKVDLLDKQSFVIAGLSRNSSSADLRSAKESRVSRVVNSLFGTDNTQSQQEEIVVIVTAHLTDDPKLNIRERIDTHVDNLKYILSNPTTQPGKGAWLSGIPTGVAGFKY
ncbi:pilus assembly protein CpaC [Epibacterium ulvae]|uniref:Pilus assembly protein CpaC n=1 Tax=Epibacterium ulvae TaxID=1156985 RepID=A0A1G5QJJ5_9RHOB|nr:pilus assembly protein N-terminal domain-containing protein [Epibacterium ulvae]SCZ61766.1 pilus assembly protein CpaC [Epibacterium ulvae]